MGRRNFQVQDSIVPQVVQAALSLGAHEITIRLSNKCLGMPSLVYDFEVSGDAVPSGERGLRVSQKLSEGIATTTIDWE